MGHFRSCLTRAGTDGQDVISTESGDRTNWNDARCDIGRQELSGSVRIVWNHQGNTVAQSAADRVVRGTMIAVEPGT